MLNAIKKTQLGLAIVMALSSPLGISVASAEKVPTQKQLQDEQILSLREQIKIDNEKIARMAAKAKVIETISSKDGTPLYLEQETATKVMAVVAVDATVLAGMTKLGAFKRIPVGGMMPMGMGTAIILLWTSYFTIEGLNKLAGYSYYNEVKDLDSTKRSTEYNQLIRSAADLKLSVATEEAMLKQLGAK